MKSNMFVMKSWDFIGIFCPSYGKISYARNEKKRIIPIQWLSLRDYLYVCFFLFFFKSFFQPSYTNNLLVNSIQSTSRSYTSSTWIFVEISFRLVCFHLLYLDFWQNRQDILMRTNIWILLLNVIFCRI